MADDLPRMTLPDLDWSDDTRAASLASLYEHALKNCTDAEAWYERKRPSKRFWGRSLRLAALVLGTIAAILPIVSEITSGDVPAGWASVALALAAGLVALDRYFGSSEAWMRFMAAEQQLVELRHAFELDWMRLRAEAGTALDQAAVAPFIDRAKQFVGIVDRAIADETAQWANDFKGVLAQGALTDGHG